ncbi:MAG: N-acetylglucosamine-6-phosphate deacetylase, partial [Spirochaetes bacterium]
MKKAIIHGDVYLENSVIQNGVVLIEDKKIIAVGDESLLKQHGNIKTIEIIDASNRCVIPGYIDTHVHGGNNYDCNDGTEEAVIRMSEFYRNHGVTAYYPSTSSDPLEKIEKGFAAIRNVMQADNIGIEILGTHMEGPFINKKHKGCQAEEQILPLTDENFKYVERNSDIIKRITLAPEIPENFNRIRELSEMGVVVSIGHSDAVYAEVLKAYHEGATMVTHLY